MTFSVRRVVTGHDASGTSVIVADGFSPQVHDRENFVEIWNTVGAPTSITAVEQQEPNQRPLRTGPPPNGSIIRVVEAPPGNRSPMHRTRTIDYGIVLQGDMWLVLEGSETLLHQGDIVIQRGTKHAWHNRSDQPTRMLFILVDGQFDPALEAMLTNMVLMP